MTLLKLPPFCPYDRNRVTASPSLLNIVKEADGVCLRPESCAECIRNHTDTNTDPQPFQKERERIKLTE